MVEFIALSFPYSSKLKVWSFHVVVVQRQQRNVQKSVMHVQSCCFAHYSPFSLIREFPNQNTRWNVSKIMRVIDRSDRNPPTIQPLVWPSDLLYVMLVGCDWWISIPSVNNMHDWRKFWKRFRWCFVFESRVSTKTVVNVLFLDVLLAVAVVVS